MGRLPNEKKKGCMSKKLLQMVIATTLMSCTVIWNLATVNVYASTNSNSYLEAALTEAGEKITILSSYGDLETAAVTWKGAKGATGYNVYYKGTGEADSKYKQLDEMLIRQYSSYFRADVLGLKEGSYVIKIVPIFNGEEGKSQSVVTSKIEVKSHTREGFAFSKESQMGTGSGGYNDDGTVPSNATVLYVTADNINTVQADVISSSKGAKTKCTGLVDILAKRQKGYDKTPLIIRMVGEVKASDINGLNSSGYIQIKGCYNVTFEGVGEDATINGWGLLIRNSRNVEVRNLGVMLFTDDGISLDTDNENIWIHNNDIFYGTAGSDADQAKGDGSCDVKGKSTYVTVSYNHFWDSGKSSLCGMSDSEEFFVSYHHNWFDHSDSRHPRIRVGTIHIYNNYFDGNSKYGVGVTKGASAFVEANAFRNCKLPMMSSLQGSDIAGGAKGTFSGEAGGMIKAYNNSITGGKGVIYAQDNKTQFDAYLASSRNESVPASYKTVSGGTTYNNFDTSSKMYSYSPHAPEDVADIVRTYAGRTNGGDFKWTFTNKDDESYSLNTALMSKIKSYKSDVVSIGGNSVVVTPGEDVETPEVPSQPEVPTEPEVPSEPETPEIPEVPSEPNAPEKPENPDDSETPEVPETPSEPEQPSEPEAPEIPDAPVKPEITQSTAQNFTKDGKESEYFNIEGNLGTDKTGITYEGLKLTKYLKLETSTNISFETESAGTLTLVLNPDFSKDVVIDGKEYKASEGIITVELEAGTHIIKKGDAAKLYYINVETEAVKTFEEVEHSFTEYGKESTFFTINGNLGTDKTGISYDNTILTKYLKIETSTDISFETDKEATLTLVFNSDFNKDIVIDGERYEAKNGIVTLKLEEGKHTIKKADVAKLYFMSITE